MLKTWGWALFLILLVSTGCAGKKTVVVLAPDPDGKVGSIAVTGEGGSVVIDAPYRGTTIGDDRNPTPPEDLGKARVEKTFGAALSVQPLRPLHVILYFGEDTSLTAASERLLPEILAAIAARKSVDIMVVGHTDSLGSREYNMDLSRRRAQTVKELLVKKGVPASAIQTTSHGKENPLIPTPDNVAEPRNRRVEVVIK
ncbi:OmpA family protein [Geomesophilobacter sediminis]|uniref:OmpA family protein n=1 Tax=Geomesophilobacter sediminis TaxID=2798584 RepID=A0A8J7J1G2_9BACT|nr:OmpA family protein [Geomesophilobacter sediminis]MBJ6724558.1 OmpA family protein [Geomesophilobacter sediminis]